MTSIDNQKVKSERDMMMERLQGRYPDLDVNDEDAVFRAISEEYGKYDKERNDYQQREKALSDMFNADPRSASFLHGWRNGDDPILLLIRQFGTDIKDAIDDPERQEQIAAANKEFLERVAKEKELEEEYQQNMEASLQALDELQEQNGLTDEQVDEAMAFLVGIIKDGVMGKFSPETIDMAMKAINHDKDVAAAEHAGEVRGKNGKVVEQLRKGKQGDGVAALGGKNGGGGEQRPRRNLGALDRFGEGPQTIWERGGEKRTPRG